MSWKCVLNSILNGMFRNKFKERYSKYGFSCSSSGWMSRDPEYEVSELVLQKFGKNVVNLCNNSLFDDKFISIRKL